MAPKPDDRVVEDYGGLQIIDARENLLVSITAPPPRGIKGSLRAGGFRPRPDGQWEQRHTPKSIMQARVIANTFFPQEK